MVSAATLNVVGGVGPRVEAIRSGWSEHERARRAVKARRQTERLAELLGMLEEEPVILAVGAPCFEDLRRMAE
jgi:hypothetical protein